MILYDLCLLPAQFCYTIVYIWKVESCVQITDQRAPLENIQQCGEPYFAGTEILHHSQSQSYFTTVGKPPVSPSSWCLRPTISNFSFFNWTLAVIVLCNVLSDQRMCMLFAIAAGPCQHSHSQVQVPWNSWPHFTVWDPWLPESRARVTLQLACYCQSVHIGDKPLDINY
jgi:hypothetical protein